MAAAPASTPAGLSIFFPAYNDSGTIASMVIRAVKTAAELTPDFEVIVVDDGSTDRSRELLATVTDQRVRVHLQARNMGKASSSGEPTHSGLGMCIAVNSKKTYAMAAAPIPLPMARNTSANSETTRRTDKAPSLGLEA